MDIEIYKIKYNISFVDQTIKEVGCMISTKNNLSDLHIFLEVTYNNRVQSINETYITPISIEEFIEKRFM